MKISRAAFLISELNLNESLYYTVSKTIFQWARENKCELVISAIAIAKRHDAEMIAVNALTSDIGYAYSSPGVESPPLTIREIILLAEDEVKKWFNGIKEKADKSGIRLRSEIIMAKRSAVSTMLDYAEEQKIDLIVVGTRDRSGIKKMLLGRVASG